MSCLASRIDEDFRRMGARRSRLEYASSDENGVSTLRATSRRPQRIVNSAQRILSRDCLTFLAVFVLRAVHSSACGMWREYRSLSECPLHSVVRRTLAAFFQPLRFRNSGLPSRDHCSHKRATALATKKRRGQRLRSRPPRLISLQLLKHLSALLLRTGPSPSNSSFPSQTSQLKISH